MEALKFQDSTNVSFRFPRNQKHFVRFDGNETKFCPWLYFSLYYENNDQYSLYCSLFLLRKLITMTNPNLDHISKDYEDLASFASTKMLLPQCMSAQYAIRTFLLILII